MTEPRETVACAHCGEPFDRPVRAPGRPRLTCSEPCRRARAYRQQREFLGHRPAKALACRICRTAIKPPAAGQRGRRPATCEAASCRRAFRAWLNRSRRRTARGRQGELRLEGAQ